MFTFVVIIISSATMASFNTMTSDSNQTHPSPCVQDRDPQYDGIRVNCKNKSISSLPLPAHWIPMETSSLLLDYNSLVTLTRTSFSTFPTWTRLRLLGLSHNHISHLEPFTFFRFKSLKKLDLHHNLINLDKNSLSGHEFDGLHNLSELNLAENNNQAIQGTYPPSLLDTLHNLQSLTLDTFNGELNFNNLFHASKSLSSVTLTGGMTRIKNGTFQNVPSFNLNKLSIRRCSYLLHIETGAFRHLKNLTWYELSEDGQGHQNSFESLSPFVGRNMSHITFASLYYDRSRPIPFVEDSIITAHKARYLSQICVENFALTDSGIFMIDSTILANPVWRRCLRTLDLSYNPLQGDVKGLTLRMSSLQRLEMVKIMNARYSFTSHKVKIWRPPGCPCKANSSNYFAWKNVEGTDVQSIGRNENNESHSRFESNRKSLALSPRSSELSSRSSIKTDTQERRRREFPPQTGVIKYIFPKRLRTLYLDGFADYFLVFDEQVEYVNGDNVEEIHVSDNGARYFTGSYRGLPNLKLLDFSRNIGSLMSPTLFYSFRSIMHLNMAEMKLNNIFMEEMSNELFSPLIHLVTLDLSGNDLRKLSKSTFYANSKLRVLLLAGNRFQSIPIDLNHVPRLCWLDLSGNALGELSEEETSKLDKHADKNQAFSLSLDGNPILCGCQSIRFLSWLARTHINLDNQGNYSCMSDSGLRTTTKQVQDLEVMWRKCNGESSILVSLILCTLMISSFFLFIVTVKFKTQLKAFLLRKFWPPFVMKTPADYPIGVYIGYADNDTNLACHYLRRFIEEKLGLSTYVRHRDLLPASDMAQSIVEAVHSSWRVLFVVSNHFLTDQWSYFALKTSAYAAQVENPGRIVLILIDGDDQDGPLLCKLPTSVLKAVQEESIITMTSQGKISYEDKQALVSGLLYQGSFFED